MHMHLSQKQQYITQQITGFSSLFSHQQTVHGAKYHRKWCNIQLQIIIKNEEEISKPYMIIHKNSIYYKCKKLRIVEEEFKKLQNCEECV
jgi:hypothetical protein